MKAQIEALRIARKRAWDEAKALNDSVLRAEIAGTVPMWEWIGDGATTYSY